MATHRISLLGPTVVPDTSGNVYWEPLDVHGTNDVWDHLVCAFEETAARRGLRGSTNIPKNYVGTASIIVVWTSAATTNNVVWDFDYRAVGGNDTESLDQAGTQESVTVTDAAPSAAFERLEASMSLTSANLAADDTLQWELFRDGSDAADTMTDEALVVDVILQFNDA